MWWLPLGIRHERIEPGRPDQNGRHEYNHERPHEALAGRTLAERYTGSARCYPARLPELAHPRGAHLRRISQQGSLKRHSERMFLSEVLARQTVGLLETEEEFFEVYYGPLLLGWFDGRSHRSKVLPTSLAGHTNQS